MANLGKTNIEITHFGSILSFFLILSHFVTQFSFETFLQTNEKLWTIQNRDDTLFYHSTMQHLIFQQPKFEERRCHEGTASCEW